MLSEFRVLIDMVQPERPKPSKKPSSKRLVFATRLGRRLFPGIWMSGKISPGICQGFDFFLAPACAAQAEAPCCTLHVRKVFKNLEKPTQTSYFQELACSWSPRGQPWVQDKHRTTTGLPRSSKPSHTKSVRLSQTESDCVRLSVWVTPAWPY